MKKIIRLLLVCLVLGGGGFYLWSTQFKANLSEIGVAKHQSKLDLTKPVHSQTILLKNLSTKETLVEQNESKIVEIASLTKLITAYLLLEYESDLTKKITIDQRIIDELISEGASLSGYKGEDEITIEDLVYGIILPSGGDAALVAANYVSGSESAFVDEMNNLASKLEMKDTHFKNATGLDAKKHYSTAEDLSKFMEVALKNEDFKKVVTTTTYQTEGTSYTPEGYYLESTLLKDSADLSLSNGEILGGKTGYAKKAGQCLISFADIDGEIYMLITTGADGNPFTEQYNMSDARAIYESIV